MWGASGDFVSYFDLASCPAPVEKGETTSRVKHPLHVTLPLTLIMGVPNTMHHYDAQIACVRCNCVPTADYSHIIMIRVAFHSDDDYSEPGKRSTVKS
jgi:hypothetical protein